MINQNHDTAVEHIKYTGFSGFDLFFTQCGLRKTFFKNKQQSSPFGGTERGLPFPLEPVSLCHLSQDSWFYDKK